MIGNMHIQLLLQAPLESCKAFCNRTIYSTCSTHMVKEVNPLTPNSEPSQISHCRIKGLSVKDSRELRR